MASSDLTDLRDALCAALHKMSSDGCVSTDFVESFAKANPHLIKRAENELLRIALLKIFHEVKGRKTPISSVRGQGELFSDYDGERFFSIPDEKTTRKITIKLDDMKCSQLQEWCEDHDREKAKKDQRIEQVRKILKRIKGHWSEGTTVREAVIAARKSKAAKKDE